MRPARAAVSGHLEPLIESYGWRTVDRIGFGRVSVFTCCVEVGDQIGDNRQGFVAQQLCSRLRINPTTQQGQDWPAKAS